MKIVEMIKDTCRERNGLKFDNGYTLTDYHYQECCENVYADWDNMVLMDDVGENSFDVSTLDFPCDINELIEPIEGLGFYMVATNGMKVRVDCYDIQNGYYSSDLSLTLESENVQTLDITGCTNMDYDFL